MAVVVWANEWPFCFPVPNIRSQYKNGNETLYSETGMPDGNMWQVKFGPDVSGTRLAGYCGLVRVFDGQPIQSLWNHVQWALKRIFTKSGDTEANEVDYRSEYSAIMMQNIAFTLRGIGMEKCCGYADSNGPWEVVTQDQVTHYDSTGQGVHGLITSTKEITLNEAAIYLAGKFGPGLVRWISRCTSPGGWQNAW